jgi:CreA protein
MIRIAALTLTLITGASCVPALAQTKIGSVDTTFRLLGANDRIVVDRYDDPDVPNVSCYVSRAETGGIKGSLGLAQDPSLFSIACRATGPVSFPTRVPAKQRIFSTSLSVFFKTLEVFRLLDDDKKVILYVVISTRIKEGSPFNSITAVPTSGG